MTTLTAGRHGTSTIASRFTSCTSTVPLNARSVSLASYTSSTLTLAQVRALSALSLHHHGHPCGCCLFTLTSFFYLFTFLLSAFFFPFFHLSDEQQLELNKKIMENLCDSANNGGEGTNDLIGPLLLQEPCRGPGRG